MAPVDWHSLIAIHGECKRKERDDRNVLPAPARKISRCDVVQWDGSSTVLARVCDKIYFLL